ncbi:MAG TPA: CDP-alcohol phosphatidyltransferase family protein, partial [Geminicoccaceae bacterium]|nr:CDP-alcohol phosphatidyltransferase family protein [Geminicoccaceae bacterium]
MGRPARTDRSSGGWFVLAASLPVIVAIALALGLPPLVAALGSIGLGIVPLACFAMAGSGRFGLANGVTLGRLELAGLAALTPLAPSGSAAWLAAGLAGTALALDGIDGWLARRFHETSAFGARFDMETDTVLLAVVAGLAWMFGVTGAWILAAPLLRPAFLLAGRRWPWLAATLPPSLRRKACCALPLLLLILALVPALPASAAVTLAALALALLALSCALDLG